MSALLRLTGLAAPPAEPTPETLFQVLEGPGAWQSVLEVAGPEPTAGNGDWYREIFAAPDAVPLAESARHVFQIEIDVAPDVDLAEFDHWYNATHVPEVRPAGLLGGRRFRALGHPRRFLALYDMTHRNVLASEELARVRGFARFTPDVEIRYRAVLQRTT